MECKEPVGFRTGEEENQATTKINCHSFNTKSDFILKIYPNYYHDIKPHNADFKFA